MATSLIGAPSRVALFVSGMIAVSVIGIYWKVQGLDLFSVVLMVAGGFDVVVACCPNSWVEKICKIGPGTQRRSSVPLKMFGGFALFSCLLYVAFRFAPASWQNSLGDTVCPACVLGDTLDIVDPTLLAICFFGCLNAVVYGSLGPALGYVSVVLRKGN
jgi:hypothetical protein